MYNVPVEELETKVKVFIDCGGEKANLTKLMQEFVDAIKKLSSDLNRCKNELCLRCGQYKTAHLGSCDDCYFRDI